jgi:hypothetical protein
MMLREACREYWISAVSDTGSTVIEGVGHPVSENRRVSIWTKLSMDPKPREKYRNCSSLLVGPLTAKRSPSLRMTFFRDDLAGDSGDLPTIETVLIHVEDWLEAFRR